MVAWLVSFGQWAAWRRVAMRFFQPGPILELASGTGGLFVDMLQAGHQPVGIDLSPYMARLANRRLQQHDFPGRLCQAQAQALPFPNDYFANVVATFPTNYILQATTLAEIHRVLQPPDPTTGLGGRLIVVMEGQLRGPKWLRQFIEWLYTITGQRDHPWPEPAKILKNQTFQSEWQLVEQNGATARLLIAHKIANPYD